MSASRANGRTAGIEIGAETIPYSMKPHWMSAQGVWPKERRLTEVEKDVYEIVLAHCFQRGSCYISYREMARDTGHALSNIVPAVNRLIDLDLMECERGGSEAGHSRLANTYYIRTQPPAWLRPYMVAEACARERKKRRSSGWLISLSEQEQRDNGLSLTRPEVETGTVPRAYTVMERTVSETGTVLPTTVPETETVGRGLYLFHGTQEEINTEEIKTKNNAGRQASPPAIDDDDAVDEPTDPEPDEQPDPEFERTVAMPIRTFYGEAFDPAEWGPVLARWRRSRYPPWAYTRLLEWGREVWTAESRRPLAVAMNKSLRRIAREGVRTRGVSNGSVDKPGSDPGVGAAGGGGSGGKPDLAALQERVRARRTGAVPPRR